MRVVSLLLALSYPLCIFSVQFFEYYQREKEGGEKCLEYYSYSSLPQSGRGIYAGKDYNIGDLTGDINPAIVIPREKMPGTQPHFYDFSIADDDPSISLLILGPGSILNHNDPPTINHAWADNSVRQPKESLRTFKHGAYYYDIFPATVEIKEGEEIFNFYGADWFATHQHSAATLDEEVGLDGSAVSIVSSDTSSAPLAAICITDVEVSPSFLPPYQSKSGIFVSAGYGLFARRAFKRGELIISAPLLFLAAEVVEGLEEEDSEIISYSIHEDGSRVYLIPMGIAVMMNHFRSLTSIVKGEDVHHSKPPNVHMQWFDFWEHFPCATDGSGLCSFPSHNKPYALHSMLGKSVEELVTMKMAPVDMGYYASRDIEAGEELLLDYGADWEQYMRHYLAQQELAVVKEGEESVDGVDKKSSDYIRHPLRLGKGSFPSHWLEPGRHEDHHEAREVHAAHEAEGSAEDQSNYFSLLREKVKNMMG